MRKIVLLVLVLIVLCVVPAFALLDDNSTNLKQGQAQGQDQGQLQGQQQGQGQAIISDIDSKIKNTSIGAAEAVGKVETKTETKINGDTTKAYAVSYPPLSGGDGVNQVNAYSIMGGGGLSDPAEYKEIIQIMQAIEASGLNADLKKDIVEKLANRLVDATRKKRWCSFGFETSGKNLVNLFGLLSLDSFWDVGQKPFHSKAKAVKTETSSVSVAVEPVVSTKGNEGYIYKK